MIGLVAWLLPWLAAPASIDMFSRDILIDRPGEVIVTVTAGCAGCNWGETGREAAALSVSVDGVYSQHLLLVRGDAAAEYRLALGALAAGRHRLIIQRDPALSARSAGPATIEVGGVDILYPGSVDFTARSMAPILYARPNTVGQFTDVPILMWYEIVPTARGRQFRYSVIFSNEDGGTATDRLMATWGRTTDIEFVYGVELDPDGQIIAEEFQGPGHEVPPFRGRHEARHPLLWVSTDNNMVSESGTTKVRYAPAAARFDLTDRSREEVMDRHSWTYALAAQEMQREGKIVNDAAPGSGSIPDLRRFVFVEACTELDGDAAVAFAVRARDGDTDRWFESDRGLPQFRIVRTGCFRGAVPLPPAAGAPDALRFRAYSRPPPKDTAPAPGSVRLTRVNKMFMLGSGFMPGESIRSWVGEIALPLDGDWREPK
jgi:hypothetical protein